tara:strand:+ start:1915 stop:2070 length:156 start_codon:yes stop_codon:yes gene_type:complete
MAKEEKFKHLQKIPLQLNEAVEGKMKEELVPSKTYVINKLLQGWVKDEIKI